MCASRTAGGEPMAADQGMIGLALSGRGIKSALFHVGVLARLAELDLLRRVDVISAVSGGALAGSLYYLHLKRALDAEGEIDRKGLIGLVAAVERQLLEAAQSDLGGELFASLGANLKRMRASYSSASRLGDVLDRRLFRPVWAGGSEKPVALRDLAIQPRGDQAFNPVTDNQGRYCKVPTLILQAANLDTGHAWRFDADGMGEPAMSPSARQLSEAPRLTKAPYRRLPEVYAAMGLGRAVAASMAAPDLLEPLPVNRLYPDPNLPLPFRRIRLVDGMVVDPFGADPLIERGCSHCIIADGSGRGAGDASSMAMRERQLGWLDARRPGRIAFIHPLSEMEAIENTPAGPIAAGKVVNDRISEGVTSYGVEREAQKAVMAFRTGLDAPSEIEAMALMADGYLISKRVFERLRLKGADWPDDLPFDGGPWRFSSMFEALRGPSKALLEHLSAGTRPAHQRSTRPFGEALIPSIGAAALALSVIALLAIGVAQQPAAVDRGWWILAIGGVLGMLLVALGGRAMRALGGQSDTWRRPIAIAAHKASAFVSALPLWLSASLRRRASRHFLESGRLRSVGIDPVTARPSSAVSQIKATDKIGKEGQKKAA